MKGRNITSYRYCTTVDGGVEDGYGCVLELNAWMEGGGTGEVLEEDATLGRDTEKN